MPTKDIINYLEQLELSEEEASLYLALLEKGPLSVRELAKIARVKRTTAYLYIDALVEKELVIKIVRGSRKQVAAIPAQDSLKHLVESKVSKAKILQDTFPSMLNTLTKSLPPAQHIADAEIRYYKGKSGVKKIYEEALRAKELRSYVNLSEMDEVFPENADSFVNVFKNNKDLIMYEIVEDSSISERKTKIFSQNKSYNFKFLPNDVKITSSDILIYDGKVGIINIRGKISGVILHNIDYYNLSRELFNFVWKILPEIKH